MAELSSALSQSQGVSERLESLLHWLADWERKLDHNKAETVAQEGKVAAKLAEAKVTLGTLHNTDSAIVELRQRKFGTDTSRSSDSPGCFK